MRLDKYKARRRKRLELVQESNAIFQDASIISHTNVQALVTIVMRGGPATRRSKREYLAQMGLATTPTGQKCKLTKKGWAILKERLNPEKFQKLEEIADQADI